MRESARSAFFKLPHEQRVKVDAVVRAICDNKALANGSAAWSDTSWAHARGTRFWDTALIEAWEIVRSIVFNEPKVPEREVSPFPIGA